MMTVSVNKSTTALQFLKSLLIACLFFISAVACDQPEPSVIEAEAPGLYAFTGVNVVPMYEEVVHENYTVVVDDGRIVATGPADETEIPDGAYQIDASGQYLMPGLSEMHGHIPGPNRRQYAKDVLFLYISNGVTLVRNMAGDAYHLDLRERVNNNEIVGPTIFAASPWLSANTIPEPADAHGVVRGYYEDGFDLMKMGSLSVDTYRALAEASREVGLPFAGHIPEEVGLKMALEERQASIDHLDRYVEFLVGDHPDAEEVSPGFFGSAVVHLADEDKIDEAIELTIEAGTWNVPTLSLVEHLQSPETPEDMAQWPEMRYMPSDIVEGWIDSKHDFQARDDFQPDAARQLVEIRQKLTRELYNQGALIALGSDAPQFFNVPGFSIHHELEMMAAAGLTPYQVLVTGTRNAALYFDMEDELGTVEKNKIADLILLNSNPLEDITNVSDQAGVMVRGAWWPADKIQERLEEVANR